MLARPNVATIAALIPVAALLLFTGGCSTSRFAVGAMVPVLDNARDSAMASRDLITFRDAAPSSLFLLEGLIATDPGNVDLRINAAMLYFSYAFAYIEDTDPDYASILYEKGFEHGWAALRKNRKISADWETTHDQFASTLPALRAKDVAAATWTAANRAQFIALHLDSTAVLREIPKVTSLLERVAELDGTYFEGLPFTMIGALHSLRPPLMGGSPEKSLQNFEKAFAVSGDTFLLSRLLLARFYMYRIQDAAGFEATLTDILARPDRGGDPYRLLNLIAKEKARILIGEIDDLF